MSDQLVELKNNVKIQQTTISELKECLRKKDSKNEHLKSKVVDFTTVQNLRAQVKELQIENEHLKSKAVDFITFQTLQVQVTKLKSVNETLNLTVEKLYKAHALAEATLRERDELISDQCEKMRLLKEQSETFHEVQSEFDSEKVHDTQDNSEKVLILSLQTQLNETAELVVRFSDEKYCALKEIESLIVKIKSLQTQNKVLKSGESELSEKINQMKSQVSEFLEKLQISDQEMKQQIILFEEDKRMFLAKNIFFEKVSFSVQKEYNDLLASNDVLKQRLETKFKFLKHDNSLEKIFESMEKEYESNISKISITSSTYGYIKNHKKDIKNGQARTRESEEYKKRSQRIKAKAKKVKPAVKSSQHDLKIVEPKKSSIEYAVSYEPPEVELKDLPPHLEYAFLADNNKLPVIIAKDLSDDEKTALIKVLKSRKQAIAWKLSDIKGINPEFCSHKILMEDDYEPAVQHQRRVNPNIHDVIKKEVERLLDTGLIYPISDSPWVSPVHCVPKKGGMTVVTNYDNELVPTRLVTGWRMLERLAGNEYYYFLDGTFQRCMMEIFHDMIEKTMEVFMDDFSVFGDSFSTCLTNLDKMLKRCKDTNLALNWEKSHFMVKEGIVLGHKISKKGNEVDKAKIDVISKLPHPTTVKGIRSFLGHAGFYRRFIKDFSKISRPMTHLLEKNTPFIFLEDCILAFQTLKQKLTEAPILIAPN
ncbi:reverse transcriptase domain-containing protein [Tanacetum coccineum]